MNEATEQSNFLTVREFCARNRISHAYFYMLAKQGTISFVKIGAKTLIPRHVEAAWLRSIGAAPAGEVAA